MSTLIKSPFDKRSYEYFQLQNHLSVLAVHDPTLDKASAAMNVGVGYFQDPPEFPGLAHFLEHMLFMGTKKYPKENDYSQFLNEHGGFSNAYTTHRSTNYYFEVGADHFVPAVDRFAQFFVAPLLNADGTEREMKAVHSEHMKNVENDHWRMYQLEKTLSDCRHPYHKFGTGNLTTLKEEPERNGLNPHAALIEFHDKWYSANIMKLVVYGKEPLKELKRIVTEVFSGIPNKNVKFEKYALKPLNEDHFKKMIYMKSLKDMKILEVQWQVEDLIEYYESKPEGYISHLLGHEAKGSVLYELKRFGFAESLSCGSQNSGDGFTLISVSVHLTEKGFNDYFKVVKIIFDYLKVLKQKPIEWIFKETQKMGEIHFQFAEESSSSSFTSRIASNMQKYKEEDILSGSYLMKEFKPDLIESLLNSINDNFRIFLVGKSFNEELDFQYEKWYGTEFAIKEITSLSLIENEKANLFLPEPNPFIPSSLEVFSCSKSEENPILLKENNKNELWFKKDEEFKVPKASIAILMNHSKAYSNALNSIACTLFTELIHDSFAEFSYYADLGGLHFSLEHVPEGFLLKIKGFDNKMDQFVSELLLKLLNFKADPERFQVFKSVLQRKFSNFKLGTPREQLNYYFSLIMQEKFFGIKEKEEALNSLTIESFHEYINEIFTFDSSVKALVHGNILEERALNIFDSICDISKSKGDSFIPISSIKLQNPVTIFNAEPCENVNSGISVYYQIGHFSDQRARVFSSLATQILSESFFDQLRTKEQLGYIVQASFKERNGSVGVLFTIQSHRSPSYLYNKINEFVSQSFNSFSSLSIEDFEKHVNSLKTHYLQKKKNIFQQSNVYIQAIHSHFYLFNKNIIDAQYLESISVNDFIKLFEDNFIKNPKVLAILDPSKELKEENTLSEQGIAVNDLHSWKKSQIKFPVPAKLFK
ncbi:hypothetical protein ROZALSC1DRAFT_30555 [Rozella allomycis CSF55]|uniref:Peptidase M16, zinc-binding site domain-containing protein n=1 Tax=Rozella allomycis (strain CSF55) TaxID=988480 RepID=A0A075AUV6_ROZAC|nr:Peptidase M16, zinc-binding site domain-containing protein [Rozella allomycis CSF55]RKP17672.1 hypothetical protein ROZALSC1DRAFT_30555 [Rozella allomycis CSF55]|eukprot:EPZ34038.1 Peptidase M16, zinc-binding site domain-containing protein [Rozella allomycis CSF55]